MNFKVTFESQMMGLEHNQSSDGRALIELMLATGLTELMLCWFAATAGYRSFSPVF